MEIENNRSENLLSDLIRVNSERIELYEKAARETNDPELKTMFTNIANQSRKFKEELVQEMESSVTDNETSDGSAISNLDDSVHNPTA